MSNNRDKIYADIVFPQPPLQKFTYSVPKKFQNFIRLGHRVTAPLGNRTLTGYVISFSNSCDYPECRPISDIMDENPVFTPDLVYIALWVADYYLSPLGDVVRAMLPPGFHQRTRLIISAVNSNNDNIKLNDLECKILDLLKPEKAISSGMLEKKLNMKNIRYTLAGLQKKNLITLEHIMEKQAVKPKYENIVTLLNKPSEKELLALEKRAPRQYQAMTQILKNPDGIMRSLIKTDMNVLNRLEHKAWIQIKPVEIMRGYLTEETASVNNDIKLTKHQTEALEKIKPAIDKSDFHVFLLHGITSSGKTQVYIETIKQTLKKSKKALVLIPEISLTPQAVNRYRGAFGDNVAVLHSRMSPGERYDSWRQIQNKRFSIALGPRSAVFAPIEDLGIIIVDEEHDTSYKQTDPSPRYHARETALMRAKKCNAVVLLGSATPSMESYYNALNGKYTLCRLPERADSAPLPKVYIINRKEHIKKEESRILSPLLKEEMEKRLNAGEQVIILQNRRGYSTFLRCRDCGAVAHCKHCDISLTYHQNGLILKCHYCGTQKRAHDTCDICGGATLSYRGIGTQRVEETLKSLFPDSGVLRMDQDSTSGKNTHHKIINAFEKNEAQILLGTQMIAKGHDFENVNLVGVISADTGIHFPDFRAGERTFQLLTQAAGRAGRRNVQGMVYIQTLEPDLEILKFAQNHDYESFYKWESEQRKALSYPPFGRLIVLKIKGKEQSITSQAANALRACLQNHPRIIILGPAPNPIPKAKDLYRMQIILRSNKKDDPNGSILRGIVRKAVNLWAQKNQHNVRVSIDVDPVDML